MPEQSEIDTRSASHSITLATFRFVTEKMLIGTLSNRSGKLERLGFIHQIGQYGLNTAGSLYSYTKSWVPKQLKPTVEKGEALYRQRGKPIVDSAANLSNDVLLLVDAKVRVHCMTGSRCAFARGLAKEELGEEGGMQNAYTVDVKKESSMRPPHPNLVDTSRRQKS